MGEDIEAGSVCHVCAQFSCVRLKLVGLDPVSSHDRSTRRVRSLVSVRN